MAGTSLGALAEGAAAKAEPSPRWRMLSSMNGSWSLGALLVAVGCASAPAADAPRSADADARAAASVGAPPKKSNDGSPSTAGTNPETKTASADSRAATNPDGARSKTAANDDAAPSTDGDGPSASDVHESGAALAPGPRVLVAVDPTFLAARLPPPLVAGAQFREVMRIDVGKSHLATIDRLGDTRFVVASDQEATVRVYDRKTKRLIGNHPIPGFREFETGGVVAWPGSDRHFLVAGAEGLSLFDAESGALLTRFDQTPAHELRWSAAGRVLLVNSTESNLGPSRMAFYRRGELTLEPLGHWNIAERVDGWDLSADGRLLAYVGYPSNELVVFDLVDKTVLLRTPAQRYAGDVSFSPDGRYLAVGGEGLLVLEVAFPERRALFAHVQNNIGHVRFSPSGDLLAASSYDGKIRLFRVTRGERLGLTLDQTLSHTGNANVYGFVFEPDGRALSSVSGDRTLRTFQTSAALDRTAPPVHFQDRIAWWKAGRPKSASTPRQPVFAGPAKPTRVMPGLYACKITDIYRLRDCEVRVDPEGRTWLSFGHDNLIDPIGVLYDDGDVVRFEGQLQSPSTVVECSAGCGPNLVHAVLRGTPKKLRGVLVFQNYPESLVPLEVPPADVKVEEAMDRFPIVLEYRGKPEIIGD